MLARGRNLVWGQKVRHKDERNSQQQHRAPCLASGLPGLGQGLSSSAAEGPGEGTLQAQGQAQLLQVSTVCLAALGDAGSKDTSTGPSKNAINSADGHHTSSALLALDGVNIIMFCGARGL